MSSPSSKDLLAATTSPIQRLLLLKFPSQLDRDTVLSIFGAVQNKATRDGHPYILSLKGGSTKCTMFASEARSQGCTFAVHSEFASEDDVRY